MVTKKKTRSKACRSFIGILLGICLITIPAVTVLAEGEDTDKQVVQTNPEIVEELEKQGALTKKEETETSTDTDGQGVELASASAVKLNSEKVGETSSYNEIIFNEKNNGVYFVHTIGTVYSNSKQYEIVFYSIANKTYTTVYTSERYIEEAYIDDTGAYFLQGDTERITGTDASGNTVYTYKYTPIVYSYKFDTKQAGKLTLDTLNMNANWANYASAFGVDGKGRFYIASYEDELHLFSSAGKHLSKTAYTGEIYYFYGFDETNGNFYYQGVANWRYWGYDHSMASLMAGNVNASNQISIKEGNIMYLYQQGWFLHKDSVAMLNGRYLAALSTFNGDVCVLLDSNQYDYTDVTESTTTINALTSGVSVSVINIANEKAAAMAFYTADSNYVDDVDISSIGPRCDINSAGTSLVVKTDENILTEYNIKTKKETIKLQTSHPVYTFAMQKDACVVIERDGDSYYLETFDWKYPTTFQTNAPASMKVGDAGQLKCTAAGGFKLDYTYKSSDSSIVSVDENGNLNAWKKGTAKITISASPIHVTKTVTIKVTDSTLSKSSSIYKTTQSQGTASATMHKSTNSGSYYGDVQTAWLTPLSNGTFERVEYVRGSVIREVYDSSYRLQSKKTISCELPYFGGFYSGKNYNYLVFGQSNTKESDKKEVIRVVKYDKKWKRISACSIKGANTYVPFDAGGLDMTETGGKLYIHTCHTMYKTSDGYHHQANCTFVIQESNMKLVDSYYDVMNLSEGYVSHSFAQQIETDGTYIYRADLGDAYPRGIALTATKAGDKVGNPSLYGTIVSIPGTLGSNYTGFTLNDLKLGENNYIVTGTGIKSENTSVRNIYINAGSKTAFTKNAAWITNYKASDKITVSNPKLVKLKDTQFLLMWEEQNQKTNKYKTRMVLLDESGKKASAVYSTPLALSMCEPVVTKSGTVVWYVTNNDSPVFVEINPYRLSKVQADTKTTTTFKQDKTGSFDNSKKSGYRKGDVVIRDKKIYKVTSSKTVAFGGVTGNSVTSLKIPNTIKLGSKTYKVTAIATRACIRQSKLKKVVIGTNVKTVGSYAFYGCKKLTTVTIGKNVTSIGKSVFYSCTSLKKITIPSKVSSIGAKAFAKCKKLSRITIKTTKLKSAKIGSQALKGISSKAVIKVPASKKASYKKILLKRGVTKKMKIKS